MSLTSTGQTLSQYTLVIAQVPPKVLWWTTQIKHIFVVCTALVSALCCSLCADKGTAACFDAAEA